MTQAAAPAPFSGNGYTETTNYHSEHQHNGAPLSRRHEYTNARGLSGNAQMIEDRFNTLPSQPPQPQPVTYVQALYDYEADDRTSLSFHEGDIIQVITQLDSGWWDGVINGVRGWFPSNYCQPISNPQDILEERHHDDHDDPEGLDDNDDYDEHFDDDDATSEYDDGAQLPIEGITNSERARADFWIPQATQDGRLFYYNTVTGESREDLPLESPSSATESGPRDRMNVNVADRTRAPQQMASQRYLQDEDYESEATSATELDGESLMMASTGSLVGYLHWNHISLANKRSRRGGGHLAQKPMEYHLLSRWSRLADSAISPSAQPSQIRVGLLRRPPLRTHPTPHHHNQLFRVHFSTMAQLLH
jgi:hypothetical protein